MATATQPESSAAAADAQNLAVENVILGSNSNLKVSKWGLSKVFTTAFRRPSLGAPTSSMPAAGSDAEGVVTRVSTTTPPLAVKDSLMTAASTQENSFPPDADVRSADSAGWVMHTGDDSSNGSDGTPSDEDDDAELSPLPQRAPGVRRDDNPVRLKGQPGSDDNDYDDREGEVFIAKDTPPHVSSASTVHAHGRDGYESWSTPPPRTHPVPNRLPSLDQSPGTLMGARNSSSGGGASGHRRIGTASSATAGSTTALGMATQEDGVTSESEAVIDSSTINGNDEDEDDEDRVVRVLLGRDESTARGLSRVTEGSREYASVSSVRSARFDVSSSSARGGTADSSLSPSRRSSSSSSSSDNSSSSTTRSSSGGSSFLGGDSSAMRGLSASMERGSAVADASTPAASVAGGAGGASSGGKGGSSSADKASESNTRSSQSESRAVSLSRANQSDDANANNGQRSSFVPHRPEGSAAAAALFEATRPQGGDERWEDRSGPRSSRPSGSGSGNSSGSSGNSSSGSSGNNHSSQQEPRVRGSSSRENLTSDLGAEKEKASTSPVGAGNEERARIDESNERRWSGDDEDDDRVVMLNNKLFPNHANHEEDDDRAQRYAFNGLNSRSPRRERSQPRARDSEGREDGSDDSEGGRFVFGRNHGGRRNSSSSDEDDKEGRGERSRRDEGTSGVGSGVVEDSVSFRRRGDDDGWDGDDVGRDALSSDEGELEEGEEEREEEGDEGAASAAAVQAAVKTLLSDTSLTVAQKMAILETQHANNELESIGGANALTAATKLLHAAPHLSKPDYVPDEGSREEEVVEEEEEEEERELIVAASSSSEEVEEEDHEEEDDDAMIARMEAEYEAANVSSSRWLGSSSSSSPSGGGGVYDSHLPHDDDNEEALRVLLASEAASEVSNSRASPNGSGGGNEGSPPSSSEEGGSRISVEEDEEEGAWAGPPAAGKGAFFNEESDVEGEGSDDNGNSSDWERRPARGSCSADDEGRSGLGQDGKNSHDDGFGSTEEAEEEEEESEVGLLESVSSSRAATSHGVDQVSSNTNSSGSGSSKEQRSSPGDASRISPPPPRSASADTASSHARPRSSSREHDPRSRSLSYGSTKVDLPPARASIPLEISSGEEDGLVDDAMLDEEEGNGVALVQNFSQGAGSAFERYSVYPAGVRSSMAASASGGGSTSSGLIVLSDSASVSEGEDETGAAGGGVGNTAAAAGVGGGAGLGGYWAVLALICPGNHQEQEQQQHASAYQEQPSLDWDGESSSDEANSDVNDDDDDEDGGARGARFAFGGLGPVGGQSRSKNPGRPLRGGANDNNNTFFGGCLPPPQPQQQNRGGFVWPWQRTSRS